MSSIKESAASFAVKKALHWAQKDPDKNLIKMLNVVEKLDTKGANRVTYANLRKSLQDPNNNWSIFIKNILNNVSTDVLDKIVPVMLNVALNSYALRTKTIEENHCNVPWAVLMDPTSACNLHCTGCWACEYDKTARLGLDTMRRIVKEGKEMGTFMYIFTGGEPMVCKDEILALCRENPDCGFLAFTNGTLIDEAFAKEMRKVGNFFPAFSIEGHEDATDMRRGNGTYQKVLKAMEILRKEGLAFGASICYHSKNVEEVCSPEYIQFLVDQGCLFAWYFTYMPLGVDAVPELMVSAEQRKTAYKLLREARNTKPIFALDFWNDGEYVQGCIAGGRHYLHINANGDVEPCAFVHYSNVNIKECSLLDALKSPLFMEYYHGQPWNENHLRPCPILDNPEKIKAAVERSGAHSTEMLAPESVDDLIKKTIPAAKAWAPVADEIWANTDYEKHNNPTVMYQDKKD